MLPGGGTVVAFCGRILTLVSGNVQMSWCKCPGLVWGQLPGMAADKCITFALGRHFNVFFNVFFISYLLTTFLVHVYIFK